MKCVYCNQSPYHTTYIYVFACYCSVFIQMRIRWRRIVCFLFLDGIRYRNSIGTSSKHSNCFTGSNCGERFVRLYRCDSEMRGSYIMRDSAFVGFGIIEYLNVQFTPCSARVYVPSACNLTRQHVQPAYKT